VNRDGGLYLACPHSDGIEAALSVRKQGGNAVDAAVAAAATLSVCYPHMTGVGGDLIAIVGTPADGLWVINGTGRSPVGANQDELRALYGDEIPRWSAAAVTVPGAVRAWADLLTRFGNTSLAVALEHAIQLATGGVRTPAHLAEALREDADRLKQDDGLGEIFYPSGRVLQTGDWLVQPKLAHTLSQIAEKGADALYRGDIGESLLSVLRANGSSMSHADLSRHESTWCRPLEGPYRGWSLCTAPPNSQGATLLAIMAEIEKREFVPDHLGRDARAIASVFKRATLTRDETLADPDGARNVGYGASGAATRGRDEGRPGARPSADTVGIVAVDDEGWWVSLNQSLFDGFGAGMADPVTGVVLHNRGAGFSLHDNVASRFRPGVRPPHTLMPTIALDNGSPVLAVATMGGSAHPQIQAEVLMSLRRGGDVRDAVRCPRWLVGGTAGENYSLCVAEGDVPGDVWAELARDFSLVAPTTSNGVGHVQLVSHFAEGYVSVADFRSDGLAYPRR